MPTFDIIRETKPNNTFRVNSVVGKFDLQTSDVKEHFCGSIDLDNEWQIGVIVGKSGTGKTTIAKELFPESYITSYDYGQQSVIDEMPKSSSVDEITRAFNSVGFSSPPSWLKPYNVLSNGEKMRVDLAHSLLRNEEIFVFDEFTSVVDRNVAKIGSHAIQKSIRRTDKKFIAVGCHFDIIDWLQPDWVFNTDSMTFTNDLKKKDQKSALRFTPHQIKQSGKCLLNITI